MPSPDSPSHTGSYGRIVGDQAGLRSPASSLPPQRPPARPWARPWPRLLSAACLLYVGVLLWATHAPRVLPPTVPVGPIPSDKTLHIAAYAILGTLFSLTALSLGRTGFRSILWLCAGLAIFACADEITQPMCGRAAEALDWVADMAGAVTAVTLVFAGGRLTQLPSAGVR